VLSPAERQALLDRQGPDPLRPESDPDDAWAVIRRSRRTVAELLMDQSVVAGVGNVYRCEVLWRHRVNPATPGQRLKRSTWTALWEDLVRLMPVGVRVGRIVTLEEDLAEIAAQLEAGEPTTGERRSAVYRRTGEACPRCGSRVRSKPVAGRTLYWCGNGQRRG
jgi:endonuclease-8